MAVESQRALQIKARLVKKATFEGAVTELQRWIENDRTFAMSTEAMQLASRCLTLCKSRYTSVVFWKATADLLQSLELAAPRTKLPALIQECQQAVSAEEPAELAADASSNNRQFFFEGQLSCQEPPPRPPDLLANLHSLVRQMSASGSDGGPASHDPQHSQSNDEPAASMQSDLELAREELEIALLESMSEGGDEAGQRSNPPASKAFVQQLPAEALTTDRLHELGGDVQCSICMGELVEHDRVQVMPCKHVFHPACLAPWLSTRNSCPVCRHELPTDDHAYERDKQSAQDAKGAANALSHQEFLYT